jgi:glycosidase
MPGTPFIYYGEEIGQAGLPGLPGDQPIRGPMSWDTRPHAGFTTGIPFRSAAPNAARHNVLAQSAGTRSILRHYKDMLQLRNSRGSIARGQWRHAFADGLVMGFERTLDRERTLVLINYGQTTKTVTVPTEPAPTVRARLLWASESQMAGRVQQPSRLGPLRTSGHLLAPQSVQVWDLNPAD